MPHTVRDLNNYFLASENYQYVPHHSMVTGGVVKCRLHKVV